jgi:hypothetical protein
MKIVQVVICLLCSVLTLDAQTDISTSIRGTIIDGQSGLPVAFANVAATRDDSLTGTVTDLQGVFSIEHLKPGRYDIHVSYVGYKDMLIPDVIVGSHQPVTLHLELFEAPYMLGEILVRPRVDKKQAQHELATVSARLLSVEEANRYAGGFDDPARLASAFAGVSSNIQSNGIVIRGNAPKYLQWKMEGVEIPNPSHFADLSSFGGGGLTALSSQVMDNTDFLTGAMPATYEDALSGVFDLSMRRGHSDEHEHQVQVGIIGIDVASEGPLSHRSNASYLVNYRYSTLGLIQPLLPKEAGRINYQDLSFKLTFPGLKKGTFEWWGLGLHDFSGQEPVREPANQFYEQDLLQQMVRQHMGATGLKYHKYLQNKYQQILRLQLAFTVSNIESETRELNDNTILEDKNNILNSQWNFHFLTEVNSRISQFHTNFSGLKLRSLHYNLDLKEFSAGPPLKTIVDENGQSMLATVYSSSSFAISPRLNFIAGFSLRYFSLNQEIAVEPRLSLSYYLKDELKAGIAYGLHSRLEPLHYYFMRDDRGIRLNDRLQFSKAHHWVASLQWMPEKNYSFKIEPYFQYLFDIPVGQESNLSFINLENDWFLQEAFSNSGIGRNMGIDLTFENYMTRGFYGLVTFSVFDSKYKNTSYSEWHSTRYNSNIIGNVLFGKEFLPGKRKRNNLGINYRLTFQGGSPYTPVDEVLSLAANEIILKTDSPFTLRFSPAFIHHFTVNYLINRKRSSHNLSLKVLNAGGFREFQGFRINTRFNTIEEYRESLVIPNLSYRISF